MSFPVSSTPALSTRRSAFGLGRQVYIPVLAAVALCVAVVFAIGIGPVYVSPWTVVRSLAGVVSCL